MSNLKYTNLPSENPGEDLLARLALDLSAIWDHEPGTMWERLNPELWEATHNPWVVLQTVSSERLDRVTSDPEFRQRLEDVARSRHQQRESQRWFQQTHPDSALHAVAYFSMEYMLTEALPIYSGGLGNVAGDQLKAANDLGVPVTAIGLLYDQGYFRQEIDRNGWQQALYPFNDTSQLPIRPVRDAGGDWLRLSLPFPGCKLWIRAWEAQAGRCKLYLLDTNDPANVPEYRNITSELYGGGPDMRLRQERVLGIGGWRLLRALGIQPEVCHLNEGHAAFAVLERAASFMDDTGQPFSAALAVTRAGNLFTTHTPVEAGFDRFPPDLMWTHFGEYCAGRLRISFEELLALGRRNPGDTSEPFNMAYLALRGSGAVNGVSRLHGAVSRNLFQPLFPRWPAPEVPVGYVTNGVHVPTWESREARHLWTQACGSDCWRTDLQRMDERIRGVSDTAIWNMRAAARKSLIEYVRTRYAQQVGIQGGSANEIAAAEKIFDPDTLTLGFARRFATYKRPTMLLHDRTRLMRILGDAQRPVQLLVAGKAHPADGPGQQMIHEWIEFIRTSGMRGRVIFLSDYDMLLTERLAGGVDLWLNTPRRPWEASGTSGMKLLVNGGLNLSELDGWWVEAYRPDVGWAIGDGREHGDDPAWDAAEADALYGLLEQQVVPEFYDRGSAGIPVRWIGRVRESMARLTAQYSANRVVREYTENHYLPAAAAYAARAEHQGALGALVLEWQRRLAAGWEHVGFGPLTLESQGNSWRFAIPVYLGSIQPEDVAVELFANGPDDAAPLRIAMQRGAPQPGAGAVYSAVTDRNRDPRDFTPRIVPANPNAAIPLEASWILWQK